MPDDPLITWLVENTLIASVAAVTVWVFCRLRTPRPAVCHALWLIILIKLITPPLLLWSWVVPSAQSDVQNLVETFIAPSFPAHGIGPAGDAFPAHDIGPLLADPSRYPTVLDQSAGPEPQLSLVGIFQALWLLGSLAFLAYWTRNGLRFRRFVAECETAPYTLQREFDAIAEELGIKAPQLLIVRGLAAPCAGGLGRPRVFWPESQIKLGPRSRLRAVLAHELAHIKRRDPLVAHLELLGTALWWWNPIFWFVRARIHEYAELACDAWALRLSAIDGRSYAETLINFNTPTQDGVATLAMSGSARRAFRRRLTAVMRSHAPSHIPQGLALALAGCALILSPVWTIQTSPIATLLGTAEKALPVADPIADLVLALGDPKQRDAAGTELIRLGRKSVPALIAALPQSGHRPNTASVLEVIGRLGPEGGASFSALFAYFQTCEKGLQMATLSALNFIAPFRSEGSARDVHPILKKLDSSTSDLDLSIALSRLKFRTQASPQRSTAELIEEIKDPRVAVRTIAAVLIGRRGAAAAAAAETLRHELRHLEINPGCPHANNWKGGQTASTSLEFSKYAAEALIAIAPNDAETAIAYAYRALHHPDHRIRLRAVQKIASFEGKGTAAALQLAEILTGFRLSATTWESRPSRALAAATLRTLGAMGSGAEAAHESLAALEADSDPRFAVSLARCLERIAS